MKILSIVGALLFLCSLSPTQSGETASPDLRNQGADIVAKVELAMLNSVDAEGFPQSRVVANFHKDGKHSMEREGKTALYFVTSKKSGKVQQYSGNPKASAYYLDLSTGSSVLYTGRIEEVDDPAAAARLWADWMKPLYQTPDNPEILVLRLVPARLKIDRGGRSEQADL